MILAGTDLTRFFPSKPLKIIDNDCVLLLYRVLCIMKYLVDAIKRILRKELPSPVGRWRIENCNTAMNQKIDLSNEDHCGPCGKYALDKMASNQIKRDIVNADIAHK